MAEVDDVRASVNFATFEENKAQNYCSRTNLSARRRDAEVEVTVAHHLGGLVGAVAGSGSHAQLSWFE